MKEEKIKKERGLYSLEKCYIFDSVLYAYMKDWVERDERQIVYSAREYSSR